MSQQFKSSHKNNRSSYKRITEQIRLQIIDRIINKQQNLKQVVEEMNINISTAKAIIKVYQKEGRVGKKQKRDKVVNIIQTFSFYYVNDQKVQKLQPTIIQENKKLVKVYQNSIDDQLKSKAKQKAEQLLEKVIQRKSSQIQRIQRQTSQQNYQHNSSIQLGCMYPYCGMPFFAYGYPPY